MLIKPEQSSHWYKPDGTPAYGATLREARKEGLYPSVTSIGQVIQKPAIDAWKQNILLDAAYEHVYSAIEIMEFGKRLTKEAWKRVIVRQWKDQMAEAAELGTRVHDAIEAMLLGKPYLHDDKIDKMCDSVAAWVDENIVRDLHVEECFAHPLGFGGRVDLHGVWGKRQRPFTLDFKTQGKPAGQMKYYPEMAIQLAANATGVGRLDGDLISLLLSTVDPGNTGYKVWGDDLKKDNGYWFGRFVRRFAVWQDENNYFPVEA